MNPYGPTIGFVDNKAMLDQAISSSAGAMAQGQSLDAQALEVLEGIDTQPPAEDLYSSGDGRFSETANTLRFLEYAVVGGLLFYFSYKAYKKAKE